MIQLKNIAKSYQQGAFALQGIDLQIHAGEIFGVIGRSGAGKSTLVRCINLLEVPDQGEVLIHGESVTHLSAVALRQARQKIGMVFQHFNLLSSRTALANVCLPLEIAGWSRAEAKQRAQELLALVGLADHQDHYPSALSGGQKQRVGIARALANEPTVLLCDEATSALDPETTASILQLLQDINAQLGLTIVLITHEMEVIKSICHRAGILDAGRCVEVASVVDIFTRPQHAVTRSLTRSALHLGIPDKIQQAMKPKPQQGYAPIVRLTFVGDQVDQPILAQVADQHAVDVNIVHATSEWIGDTPIGFTLCQLLGEDKAVEKALSYIESQNVQAEVRGYVPVHALSTH